VLERRRQSELLGQAATLADSPTLKASVDTYADFAPTANDDTKVQLFATITNELEKVAARIEADAVVLVDIHQNTLAAAGRQADRWPRGRPVSVVAAGGDASIYDGIVHLNDSTVRVVAVPMLLSSDSAMMRGTATPAQPPALGLLVGESCPM